MEKGLKAFFYEYKYYLFPEDCISLAELKTRGKATVKRLKEDRCMAPDFIYESMEEEELTIENPERLFEVSVNLYSGKEYDEILKKQVDRVCPGCRSFIPDGDPRDTGNLDGHHREISLDGACYERIGENEFWDFGTSVDVFWYVVSEKLNELAVCIDKGNQKKLNKILNKELTQFFVKTEFYGAVVGGKYCLCICFGSMKALAFYSYLAYCGAQKGGYLDCAGWTVLPYRPAEVTPYRGKTNISALRARLAEDGLFADLSVYTPKPLSAKKQSKLAGDIYTWLRAQIGEEKVPFTLGDIVFGCEAGEYVSFDEIANAMRERFTERYGDSENGFLPVLGYSADGEQTNQLPYRELIREGGTGCPMLSMLDTEQLKEDPWWRKLITFAYLYIPRPLDVPDSPAETLAWYLKNMDMVPQPLRDPEDFVCGAMSVGIADCGEHGFILDHFVASEKKFFRSLRILAPVLSAFRAKVVEVNGEGVMTYDCGYDFKPET